MSARPATGHTSLLRKLLLTIMIVGASGSTIGAGTFASYNATTTNGAANFDTNYLALSEIVNSGTACFSWGDDSTTPPTNFVDGNLNTDTCDSIFAVSNVKPGDTAVSANFLLENKGGFSANTLRLHASACTVTENPSVTTHGGGNPCDSILINVAETNTSFGSPDCRYPTVSTSACPVTDLTKTVSAFSETYGTAASSLDADPATQPIPTGTSGKRYYQVKLQLPAGVTDNTIQGMQVTFALTWILEQ